VSSCCVLGAVDAAAMASGAGGGGANARPCPGVGVRQHINTNGGQSLSPVHVDPRVFEAGNMALVLVSLGWVCAIYVWRICYPMLCEKPSALGTRAMGIGLLVGFSLLWLMGTCGG